MSQQKTSRPCVGTEPVFTVLVRPKSSAHRHLEQEKLPTSCSKVLLENLAVVNLVKNNPPFMEHKD
jgi:hypothetical protein